MITSLKPLLKAAKENNFAYGAFNVNSVSQIRAALRIHEIFNSPMLLQGAELANVFMSGQADFKNGTFEQKAKGMKIMADAFREICEKSKIPCVLHLDHGTSFEVCKAAIDAGYTSVMIDGSSKSLDENIALTKRVVDYAKDFGVSVEGELGVLAGVEDHVFSKKSTYTNPLDAVRFVKETGVDALAISYGTSHGANKGANVVLRKEIPIAVNECLLHEGLKAALVSHGSSNVDPYMVKQVVDLGGDIKNAGGIPIPQLQEVISSGIRKINVDTDIRLTVTRNIRQLLAENKELLDDPYVKMVYKRLKDDPSNFDPRYYMQDLMDTMVRDNIPSKALGQLIGAMDDGVMEVCGRMIIAFDSYEKYKLVEI
ncbi:MAG: class II fructose-bisphosphate aldolase [Anaerococcus sp.]|nr:class II fructose-bisphosphate aldolase [Anaerococcus sp.]